MLNKYKLINHIQDYKKLNNEEVEEFLSMSDVPEPDKNDYISYSIKDDETQEVIKSNLTFEDVGQEISEINVSRDLLVMEEIFDEKSFLKSMKEYSEEKNRRWKIWHDYLKHHCFSYEMEFLHDIIFSKAYNDFSKHGYTEVSKAYFQLALRGRYENKNNTKKDDALKINEKYKKIKDGKSFEHDLTRTEKDKFLSMSDIIKPSKQDYLIFSVKNIETMTVLISNATFSDLANFNLTPEKGTIQHQKYIVEEQFDQHSYNNLLNLYENEKNARLNILLDYLRNEYFDKKDYPYHDIIANKAKEIFKQDDLNAFSELYFHFYDLLNDFKLLIKK